MQTGEVIVARLSGGISIGRCLAQPRRGERVRISVGRNREAQIPADRVILATGMAASTEEEVQQFRGSCEGLASEIDLSEVWEVARDTPAPMSLDSLVELYWGSSPGVAQRVALLLYLDRTSLYFVGDGEGYTPRTKEAVQEIQARRQREEEHAQEAASLAEHLSRGRLPPRMTRHQSGLLEHMRGYAVHGENYTRSGAARGVLERVESGTGDLQRLSFELLVRAGVFSPDEPLEVERAGIREEFSDDAQAEAATIDLSRALGEPGRQDLTTVSTVTIDDAGTEDRDDALSLEVDEPGRRYRIGIHIADAGALIPPGGALDQEADQRMATLYLPERKVPMLPPDVSNKTGSLAPGENRVALSLLADISEAGEVLSWEVVPSVARSQAALSYDDANQAMADVDHPRHHVLAALSRVAQSLRRKREEAGAVTLERPEMLIKADASGRVTVRVVTRSTPARMMVTEVMILCNSLLAEFCRRQGLPAAYRSQAAPDLSDIATETPEGPLRWYLVMRRLPPADLNTVPAAHAGLGVPAYIQATSPLRRYPDLVMQRQISRFLSSGKPLYSPEAIASVTQRAEVQLRELSRLEEERRRYWFLKYLKQNLSQGEKDDAAALFRAIVLENQPGRLAPMELTEYPFRVRAELPASCEPGDTVTLRLHGVDLWRRVGQFVHEPSTQ